ncbi:hypothetical protein ACQPZ8_45975 [Actinomadura nitritigenes]|uniref:hypothetical protein n=1 Tax=Actinomadura nitritigenes TaxID=134602 RepID=UPI003D8B9E59
MTDVPPGSIRVWSNPPPPEPKSILVGPSSGAPPIGPAPMGPPGAICVASASGIGGVPSGGVPAVGSGAPHPWSAGGCWEP